MGLTLSVLLAILGVAAFPCWRHSARWGYAPSMMVGFLLVLVAALTVGGRPLTDDGRLAHLKTLQRSHDVIIANASNKVELPETGPP